MMKSLSGFDIVAILWLFSGIIYVIYFLNYLQYKKEFKNLIDDLVWNSGFDRRFFFWLTLFTSFTFGFLFLPKRILKWLGVIEDKN